ncbi:hypothetical protein CCC_03947 [Paramagnetospirillum magnetotacticum MS-1]|uniref:Cytochrome C Planctomycete-type domain-containing protein n=1 Tax=Paramagnetospirillum magnetotacticum MS-1 TaxID=272627 RepID=A0A0C2YYN2_PARME|nr:c-type cytochrome domain-containing protein [Paramagnetospirillum magnetotacticum]KIL99775.1 hypothetical protein CCC_03947 [Paramagnetospirillum magnetotacticum MS-1]
MTLRIASIMAGALALLAAGGASAKEPPVSFAEDILPILQVRCSVCHQKGAEGFEKSGFDLTSYEGLMKGTKFGPMVVAGDPTTSNLMVLIDGRADKSIQMPHGKKKLTSCDRDLIRRWIKQGAQNN